MHPIAQEEGNLQALLVEDDLLSRQAAATLLRKQGYNLETAATVKEAIEKSRKKVFDLIYTDLGLPDGSGLAFATSIRQDATNPNHKTTIIGLTAYIDQQTQEACIQAEIQYLLIKPLDSVKVETAEVIMNNHISGRKLDLFLNQQSSVTLAIIDLEAALKNASGNAVLVKEMLTQFMKELVSRQQEISIAFQEKNWGKLEQLVHKLHGAAAYCGVPRLRAAVNAFEAALRNHAEDYREVHATLMREIEILKIEYLQKRTALFKLLESSLDTIPAQAAFAGQRLLLVEDELINQVIIKELLETLGFKVTSAPDGQSALRLLQAAEAAYHVVIMDVGLPDISGIEVTRRIRGSTLANKDIPIIALTGHVSQKYKADCLDSGMNGFLGKPTTREQLQQALSFLQAAK